jgi:hypothetical protein
MIKNTLLIPAIQQPVNNYSSNNLCGPAALRLDKKPCGLAPAGFSERKPVTLGQGTD